MLNAWTPWLPRWQSPLMPPAPSAPPPGCLWLDAAVRRAGLEALLAAPPGTTLLAPTDAAVDTAGLRPLLEAPEALQRWLLGHLTLASPQDGGPLPLLDGSLLRRAGRGPGWQDAEGGLVRLLGRPRMRQNLRVQLIDRSLAAASRTLWQRVAADPALARLADALSRCGLDVLLGCRGPFTLFAPTGASLDRAAARLGLPPQALWQDAERLRALLLLHIVPGRWASGDFPSPGHLRTLGDRPLRSGELNLSSALGSDQPCSNGLLHRLPEALLPA